MPGYWRKLRSQQENVLWEREGHRAGLKSWDVRNQIPVSQSQSLCSLKGKVCEEVLTHPAPRFFSTPVPPGKLQGLGYKQILSCSQLLRKLRTHWVYYFMVSAVFCLVLPWKDNFKCLPGLEQKFPRKSPPSANCAGGKTSVFYTWRKPKTPMTGMRSVSNPQFGRTDEIFPHGLSKFTVKLWTLLESLVTAWSKIETWALPDETKDLLKVSCWAKMCPWWIPFIAGRAPFCISRFATTLLLLWSQEIRWASAKPGV